VCDCDRCSKKCRLRRAFLVLVFQFRSRFHSLFVCDCDRCCKKFRPRRTFVALCISLSLIISLIACLRLWQMLSKTSPAAGLCHSCISISFTIPFLICVQPMTNAAKKIADFRYSYISILNFLAPRDLFLPTRPCIFLSTFSGHENYWREVETEGRRIFGAC